MNIKAEKTSLDIMAEKYIEKKNLIKKLEEELDAMKADIIPLMEGKDNISTYFHKITNKEQIRDGINLQKLKEDYPDAYSNCFKPSIFTKFIVK